MDSFGMPSMVGERHAHDLRMAALLCESGSDVLAPIPLCRSAPEFLSEGDDLADDGIEVLEDEVLEDEVLSGAAQPAFLLRLRILPSGRRARSGEGDRNLRI